MYIIPTNTLIIQHCIQGHVFLTKMDNFQIVIKFESVPLLWHLNSAYDNVFLFSEHICGGNRGMNLVKKTF